MKQQYVMELALLVLTVFAATVVSTQDLPAELRNECPAKCVCSWWLNLPSASCTSLSLFSVYAGVPSIVQALDLSNNTVSQLDDRQLSRAGLTKLRYLNLSMNAISEIGLHAFQDLRNLTVLDLSMNRLDYVASDTFYYSTKLRILNLAGNKFNLHVPELHSSSITDLDLSGCRINHLVKSVFVGLKQLRKLDLSNNMLFDLDKDVLRPVPYLRTIMLGRNKFICDGASIDSLKLHLRNRNIYTDTFCEKSSAPTREQFEKIIAMKTLVPLDDPNYLPPPSRLPSPPTQDPWNRKTWREFEEVVREQEHEPVDVESSGIFANTFNNVSPFWFLLIGFLLGSGATMVVTYLWLSTTISCLIPRIRRAEAADSTDASSQRVSLLRHLWQQEHHASAEDSTVSGSGAGGNTSGATVLSAPSCPGTPPPPYREVMLHRNLYPRAAMAAAAAAAAANIRGNDTTPVTYNV